MVLPIRAILYCVILCYCAPKYLLGCTCIYRPTCNKLQDAEVAVLATVKFVPGKFWRLIDARSTIRVDKVWKGPIKESTELRIDTMLTQPCGLELSTDHQYVIFASRDPQSGSLQTGACSGSFDVMAGDRRWIESLSSAMKTNSGFIYGSLSQSDVWRRSMDNRNPLPDTTVLLSSQAHTIAAVTNRKGEFFIPSIPPGNYAVSANFRKRALVFTSGATQSIVQEIEVASQGCTQLTGTLPKDIVFQGRVLDQSNKPVDSVEVLALPESSSPLTLSGDYSSRTDSKGRFLLADLVAGAYRLMLRIPDDSKSTAIRSTYYPSSLDLAKSRLWKVDQPRSSATAPRILSFRALPAPRRTTVKFLLPAIFHEFPNAASIFLKLKHNPHDLTAQLQRLNCPAPATCEVNLPEGEGFGVVIGNLVDQISPLQHTARPGLTIDLRKR